MTIRRNSERGKRGGQRIHLLLECTCQPSTSGMGVFEPHLPSQTEWPLSVPAQVPRNYRDGRKAASIERQRTSASAISRGTVLRPTWGRLRSFSRTLI